MKKLHLITQRDQPYMSTRMCCERCGLAKFKFKENGDLYVDEEYDYTPKVAIENIDEGD